jgi:hypothetical protein
MKFLLVRIECYDFATNELILNQDGEPIITGTLDCGVTRNEEDQSFESQMKIQFTEVSFHYDNKNFCLKISYFRNDDLVNPIMVLASPSYKVYARKPTLEKRKLDSKKIPSKKMKMGSSIEWRDFEQRFNEFQLYLSGLDQKERREIMNRFLQDTVKHVEIPQENVAKL